MEEAADRVFDQSLAEKDTLVVSENERMTVSKAIINATNLEDLKAIVQEFAEANEGNY